MSNSASTLSQILLDCYGYNPFLHPLKYNNVDRVEWTRMMASVLRVDEDTFNMHMKILNEYDEEQNGITSEEVEAELATKRVESYLEINYPTWSDFRLHFDAYNEALSINNKKIIKNSLASMKAITQQTIKEYRINFLVVCKYLYSQCDKSSIPAFRMLGYEELPLYQLDEKLFKMLKQKSTTKDKDVYEKESITSLQQKLAEFETTEFVVPRTSRFKQIWSQLKPREKLERKYEAILYMLAEKGEKPSTIRMKKILNIFDNLEKNGFVWHTCWSSKAGKLDFTKFPTLILSNDNISDIISVPVLEKPKVRGSKKKNIIANTTQQHSIQEQANDRKLDKKIKIQNRCGTALMAIALSVLAKRKSVTRDQVLQKIFQEYDLPLTASLRTQLTKMVDKLMT